MAEMVEQMNLATDTLAAKTARPLTALTVKKRRLFLQTLEETTNVAAACRAIGMSRQGVYNWRKQDAAFAEEWDAALNAALDHLEQTAVERAHSGSDLLMMFLLKANRPEKYRETIQHQASGEVRVVFTNDWRGGAHVVGDGE